MEECLQSVHYVNILKWLKCGFAMGIYGYLMMAQQWPCEAHKHTSSQVVYCPCPM